MIVYKVEGWTKGNLPVVLFAIKTGYSKQKYYDSNKRRFEVKVLVINCGSSSLKYRILDMRTEELLVKGLVERIALPGSVIIQEKQGDRTELDLPLQDHKDAISHVLGLLTDEVHGVLKSLDEISAVGHRIVHGGEHYSEAAYVTDEVIEAIEQCKDMAPLHNHAHVLGIRACRDLMPNTPMVCVFDTAFHQTMPPESYLYAIPYEFYEKYKIRRYGFHGTSHGYVSKRAAEILGKDLKDLKMITCHLGNGASLAAIKGGKCFDTSMGLTPLDGLVMGTRSGVLDPAILTFLAEKENMSAEQVLNMLNKKSGILGLSGISSDFRDVEAAAKEGNERAHQALDVYVHRVKAYIGSYAAEMNGLDVLVFTAGVGENDRWIRSRICENMDFLGIELDPEKNQVQGEEAIISTEASRVKIMVLPTHEELVIARSTKEIVEKL